jgi:hypothetical protein
MTTPLERILPHQIQAPGQTQRLLAQKYLMDYKPFTEEDLERLPARGSWEEHYQRLVTGQA